MLKKTITYDDLDGNKVSEDFYFNLNKAELTEMEFSEKGGLGEYVKRIVAENDYNKLVIIFKDLLIRSVGKRSEDGRRFIKNQEITDYFTQTNAYSELFIELATNEQSAIEFIKGVVPAGLEAEMNATQTQKTAEPAWLTEGRTPTPEELRNATPEQLQVAFARKQEQQTAPSA